MVVSVLLHTILQRPAAMPPAHPQPPPGAPRGSLVLRLPEGATLGDVLLQLEIPLEPEALILVVNHRIADIATVLTNEDRVDIIPAISGG